MVDYSEVVAARDADLMEFAGDDADSRRMRASILRMANSMLPPEDQFRKAKLTVQLRPRESVDGSLVGRFADAVQRATAKLAASRIEHASVTIASAGARRRAPVELLPSAGGTLVFDLAPDRIIRNPDGTHSDQMMATPATFAELAVGDLCESLPSEGGFVDDELDAILSASASVRSAIRGFVDIPMGQAWAEFTLTPHRGELVRGTLAPAHVSFLRRELHVDAEAKTTIEHIDGYLDGARLRRRIFYLDTSETTTIEGSIDPGQVEAVRAAENKQVRITVEATRRKWKRTLYNLVDIVPQLPYSDS